jgi:hypothetical protein
MGRTRAHNVHVSFLGYDDGAETERTLDGRVVSAINPACGSGNFLYICLQALKDLERRRTAGGWPMTVRPMRMASMSAFMPSSSRRSGVMSTGSTSRSIEARSV